MLRVYCSKLLCKFQYPLRVEVGCNPADHVEMSAPVSFQYPLRVEVGCNAVLQAGLRTLLEVSVPSTGRSGLQLSIYYTQLALVASFSTLYGSKWVATGCSLMLASGFLSFSTLYGSKWVATGCGCPRHPRKQQFQYPLRVEVGCNAHLPLACLAPLPVSVPSTGRSGLQRAPSAHSARPSWMFQYPLRVEVGCNPNAHHAAHTPPSFSTLYGSKWVATLDLCRSFWRGTSFSTLYGSKWVATRLPPVSCACWHRFQYPLRVEVGCNIHIDDRICEVAWFQYPLRVEVGCNTRCAKQSYAAHQVSVPSTGRSGLQPDTWVDVLALSGVSVPSTGRSGLQLQPCFSVLATRT